MRSGLIFITFLITCTYLVHLAGFRPVTFEQSCQPYELPQLVPTEQIVILKLGKTFKLYEDVIKQTISEALAGAATGAEDELRAKMEQELTGKTGQ